jgi:glycine betaine/choline ABC-type transport system substrate-binding protein
MGRTKIIAALTALLLGAGCTRPGVVTVGSKNFTEQLVLGEILAQQIERRLKTPVARQFNLGGTLVAHQALLKGAIDLYPEYTGTAAAAILKREPARSPAAVFAEVKAAYQSRWRLAWLPPLGFDDTFAIAVRGDTARVGRLRTISDAAGRPGGWKLGIGYEFLQRSDGLAGLVRTYGLRLDGPPVTMDLGLLYEALRNHRVDMVAGNSTDAQLSVLDVRVLADDRAYFPPYQCAVVVRQETLARHPGLGEAIGELSGAISDEVMRKLNHLVEGEHRPVREVAAEFLNNVVGRK